MKRCIKPKNLRQQVSVERRRRTLIFFTIITVALIYIGITMIVGNMGVMKYLELQKNKNRLQSEIANMEKENKMLRAHVDALKRDPFYIEKQAREEYGLAKPDEYIFQFQDDGR